jgi:hypothetical protein
MFLLLARVPLLEEGVGVEVGRVGSKRGQPSEQPLDMDKHGHGKGGVVSGVVVVWQQRWSWNRHKSRWGE